MIVESRYEGVDGLFLHPVENEDVMAGNGTIGIEILEDLPDVDAVLIPWGGGGLTVGIASAIKAKRPETKIYVEQETAAPLNATLAAGTPTEIEYEHSFIDGRARGLSCPDVGAAEPARRCLHHVAGRDGGGDQAAGRTGASDRRGAGALAPAAALSGRAGEGKIVCIVSGEHRLLDALENSWPAKRPSCAFASPEPRPAG